MSITVIVALTVCERAVEALLLKEDKTAIPLARLLHSELSISPSIKFPLDSSSAQCRFLAALLLCLVLLLVR